MERKILYIAISFIVFISLASAAQNDYKITYRINIDDGGAAYWNVEYRTLLTTKDDISSFENYSQQLESVYINEFKQLMQKSASQASVATSRTMVASDFTGDASIQTTPTGTYGVVHYSFKWTNFAKMDSNINIGDAFVGGLYLSKDNALIIQYPSGYVLEQVTPAPDQNRDGLTWYGLRSFGAGEPRVILAKASFPWIPLILGFIIVSAGVILYVARKRKDKSDSNLIVTEKVSETELMDLEDRILKLLKESDGSLYQSEIGKKLDLPKSTVSSALNELSNKNLIQKIKKGRENLIRLS
jgi:uncharacterized membrane protein